VRSGGLGSGVAVEVRAKMWVVDEGGTADDRKRRERNTQVNAFRTISENQHFGLVLGMGSRYFCRKGRGQVLDGAGQQPGFWRQWFELVEALYSKMFLLHPSTSVGF